MLKKMNIPVKLTGDLTKEHWDEAMPFEVYAKRVAAGICASGYRGLMIPGMNPQGLQLFVVGESYRSRALAIHPDDPRGVIYLLEDSGRPVTADQHFKVDSAITVGALTQGGYTAIYRALDLDNDRYENDRLESATAITI